MKAVILAGGEGTRLRPLTSNLPKPMMPIVNRPMLEHIVALLAQHGFDDIVITVAYLANQIRTYFGDGSDYGVRIRYATDEEPRGTAGSVRNAAAELDDTFLVISGDVLTDIDLSELTKAHHERAAPASIALKRVDDPLEFGIVITRPDHSIERFLEKPSWGEVFSDTINTGIYVLEPDVFDFIPDGEVVDFAADVFPAMLERGLAIHGHVVDGYWEDVGTIDAYVRAHADVLDGRVSVEVAGFPLGEGIWLGAGAEIDPGAHVDGPSVIGDNCRIEAGARLAEYAVLGTDVVVKADSHVERSVLHDHVYVGRNARVRGAVVGRSTNLRSFARLEEGVVVGDECLIGEHAVVNAGVKIYPFKTVEPQAVVNSSIVWETRGVRTLFGRRGVRGLANVDITPELAVRVAMAYGTALPKGSIVTTSRDTSRAARALKRAVIAGLNLAGVTVEDIELATVPLTRFQARNSHARGAVTVHLAADDSDSIELRFFDGSGLDLDPSTKRRIEQLLQREDYRRAFSRDIGDIVFPPRAIEFYAEAMERLVDMPRVREHGFRVVIDYSFGAASIVGPSVLGNLRAEVLAVNPYASTAALTSLDPEAQREHVSQLVRTSGSHLGCVLAPGSESLVLIDDEGRVLSDGDSLLALVSLVAEAVPDARIAVPVCVTQAVSDVAEAHGAEVVWTKLADAELMTRAASRDVTLAASGNGGFIWPEFLPAYDAMATMMRLIDLLSAVDRPLSDVVKTAPRGHVAHVAVPTAWERKGTVMRELLEHPPPGEVMLVDGIKVIRSREWILVLPDPEEPLTHVWAEAESDAVARTLAKEQARKVRQLLR